MHGLTGSDDGDLVLGGQVQRTARLLVQHVLLDGAILQQQHTRFKGLPILIETAKAGGSERPGVIVEDPYDVQNLATLRRLRAGAGPAT